MEVDIKMKQLTEKQKEIFKFIKDRIKKGLPPTIREIAANFNMTEGGAYGHLESIVRKGYLTKEYRKSRAISLNIAD